MRNLPDVPTLDVFLGLVSAILLLLALVYVARERPETFRGFRRRPRRREHHPVIFQDVFLPDSNRGLSFIGSLFCHMVGFSLVPWMQFVAPRVTMPDARAPEIVELDYRIPDIPVVAPEDLYEEKQDEDSSEERDNGGSEEEGASSKPAEAAAEKTPKKGEEAREAPAPPPEIATAPEPPKPEPQVFQQVFKVILPEIVGKHRSLKEIILQTNSLLELPPEYAPQLPPILAWTPNPLPLESGMVIEPGHQQPETIERWELPEQVSHLAAPNREIVLADLSVTPVPVLVEDPALPVPAANVLPLAGLEMPEPVQPELPSLAEGESRTTLIALSQEPNPLTPSFLLEMGLRLGSLDSAMEEVEDPPAQSEADEEEPEQPPEPEPPPEPEQRLDEQPVETALDTADETADPTPEPTDAPPTIVESDAPITYDEVAPFPAEFDLFAAEGVSDVAPMMAQAVDFEAEGEGRGGTATEGAGMDEEVAPVEVVDIASVRVGGSGDPSLGGPAILELPGSGGPGTGNEGEGEGKESPEANEGDGKGTRTGSGTLKPLSRKQYGIILVSNVQTTLTNTAGILKGNPIYMIHLDVPEALRKWTLQFCIPGSGSRKLDTSTGIIRILPKKKVAPPFPLEQKPLRLEAAPATPERPLEVVIYAIVDEEGGLGNLRVVHGADPQTDNTILAHLESWDFLPAFRGEEPVLVEALFGIPLP